jgi:serine/threonine-protein phosphatase 2B catalytic subunit
MRILNQALDILKKEPNLVKIPEPVVVVGDIHG